MIMTAMFVGTGGGRSTDYADPNYRVPVGGDRMEMAMRAAEPSGLEAYNMRRAHRDAKIRSRAPNGKVYAAIMDTMRYGG